MTEVCAREQITVDRLCTRSGRVFRDPGLEKTQKISTGIEKIWAQNAGFFCLFVGKS